MPEGCDTYSRLVDSGVSAAEPSEHFLEGVALPRIAGVPAAVRVARLMGARHITLAVPVGSRDALDRLGLTENLQVAA